MIPTIPFFPMILVIFSSDGCMPHRTKPNQALIWMAFRLDKYLNCPHSTCPNLCETHLHLGNKIIECLKMRGWPESTSCASLVLALPLMVCGVQVSVALTNTCDKVSWLVQLWNVYQNKFAQGYLFFHSFLMILILLIPMILVHVHVPMIPFFCWYQFLLMIPCQPPLVKTLPGYYTPHRTRPIQVLIGMAFRLYKYLICPHSTCPHL